MTYRYIEFTDRTAVSAQGRKHGIIYYAGTPSAELIEELGLEVSKPSVHSITTYQTTLEAMGEKGWELQFVTPCGANFANIDRISGPIENSYIFRKSE